MAASATSSYRLLASIRLKKVEVWAPASAGSFATASVEFTSTASTVSARRALFSDTTLGTARPAYVHARPSPESLAGMWFTSSGTATLFSVTCPSGSVIDVSMSVTFVGTEGANARSWAPAALTAGRVYCSPLEGSGGVCNPVGWSVST